MAGELRRRNDGWAAGAELAKRALRLAEDLGDTETAFEARCIVAFALPDGQLEATQQVLEDAKRANLVAVSSVPPARG
jgi:hypothetical protein